MSFIVGGAIGDFELLLCLRERSALSGRCGSDLQLSKKFDFNKAHCQNLRLTESRNI